MKTNFLKLSIAFLFCSFLVFQYGFSQNSTDKKYAQEATETSFYKSIEKGVTIVDFWASWCRPCKTQSPIFEEAAKEMKGKAKFLKIDVDSNRNLASRLKVASIPTLIIFKDGKEVNRLVGTTSKEVIIQELKKYL